MDNGHTVLQVLPKRAEGGNYSLLWEHIGGGDVFLIQTRADIRDGFPKWEVMFKLRFGQEVLVIQAKLSNDVSGRDNNKCIVMEVWGE